jgi:hypothetical protein
MSVPDFISNPRIAGRYTDEPSRRGNVPEFDNVDDAQATLGVDGRRESKPDYAVIRGGRVVAPRGCEPAEIPEPRYRRAKAGVLVNVVDNGPADSPAPVPDNPMAGIAWPLKRLLSSEDPRLLVAAQRYRAVFDSVSSDISLRGVDLGRDLYRIDQRTWVNPVSGDIEYKGPRRVKKGDLATPPKHNGKATRGAWNGDAAVLRKIDAKSVLERLRGALGPITQPFEAAVCHCSTMKAIGEKEGFKGKPAEAVGKAFVFRGLHVIAAEFELIDSETEYVADNDNSNGTPNALPRAG